MAYRAFEELEVWKLGCRLAVRVYELLKECRDFGLRDQMTRMAVAGFAGLDHGERGGGNKEQF